MAQIEEITEPKVEVSERASQRTSFSQSGDGGREMNLEKKRKSVVQVAGLRGRKERGRLKMFGSIVFAHRFPCF